MGAGGEDLSAMGSGLRTNARLQQEGNQVEAGRIQWKDTGWLVLRATCGTEPDAQPAWQCKEVHQGVGSNFHSKVLLLGFSTHSALV